MTVMPRKTYYFEDLDLGMEASLQKVITEADVNAFAEVTGDKNPVHRPRLCRQDDLQADRSRNADREPHLGRVRG